jgi:hypothetical protein
MLSALPCRRPVQVYMSSVLPRQKWWQMIRSEYVCLCMYVCAYRCICRPYYRAKNDDKWSEVCLCMYACMHVCMYVCMYRRICRPYYRAENDDKWSEVCLCMYVCMHVFMYVCAYMSSTLSRRKWWQMIRSVSMYVFMHACMYVCICVYHGDKRIKSEWSVRACVFETEELRRKEERVFICICIYTYIHVHIHTQVCTIYHCEHFYMYIYTYIRLYVYM